MGQTVPSALPACGHCSRNFSTKRLPWAIYSLTSFSSRTRSTWFCMVVLAATTRPTSMGATTAVVTTILRWLRLTQRTVRLGCGSRAKRSGPSSATGDAASRHTTGNTTGSGFVGAVAHCARRLSRSYPPGRHRMATIATAAGKMRRNQAVRAVVGSNPPLTAKTPIDCRMRRRFGGGLAAS